jgi:hypothetical protein
MAADLWHNTGASSMVRVDENDIPLIVQEVCAESELLERITVRLFDGRQVKIPSSAAFTLDQVDIGKAERYVKGHLFNYFPIRPFSLGIKQ